MSETTTATLVPESWQQPASATATESQAVPTVVSRSTENPVAKAEPAATPEPAATASPAIQISSPVVESVTKQDEGPEPQSSLTKKFTTPEWSALKEFRV